MSEPLAPSLQRPLVSLRDIEQHALGSGFEPVFVDCRFELSDTNAGEAAWRQARIPGSRYLHLDRDLSGPVRKGRTGRHPLPDAERLKARFAEVAIDAEAPVVFLDDTGGAYAARAWWLACWLGHPQAHVLDGGWQAWVAAGREIASGAPEVLPPAAPWPVRASLVSFADAADVTATFDHPHPLVDARAKERFEGTVEPLDTVAGHIPGAQCMPHVGNLGTDGRFLAPAVLADRWRDVLGPDPSDAICYCGSGVTAAHNVLAIVAAGLPAPRLYVGSWSEWITDPAHRIATGVGVTT